jgi:hypothetical protein
LITTVEGLRQRRTTPSPAIPLWRIAAARALVLDTFQLVGRATAQATAGALARRTTTQLITRTDRISGPSEVEATGTTPATLALRPALVTRVTGMIISITGQGTIHSVTMITTVTALNSRPIPDKVLMGRGVGTQSSLADFALGIDSSSGFSVRPSALDPHTSCRCWSTLQVARL